MQFVDALVRCAPGLSGIALEITSGFAPAEPGRRDLLDLSRLLDIWGTLGLPLYVTIAAPSSGGQDAGGRFARSAGFDGPENSESEEWNETLQAEWVDAVLPLLLAKQSVAGITWAHLDDGGASEFPTAGLLDGTGSPRSVVQAIHTHRFGHWPAN